MSAGACEADAITGAFTNVSLQASIELNLAGGVSMHIQFPSNNSTHVDSTTVKVLDSAALLVAAQPLLKELIRQKIIRPSNPQSNFSTIPSGYGDTAMTIVLQRISEGEDQDTSSGFGAVESEYGNLPLRQLSYHARMLGMSVQTTILQTFYNPFDEPIEANYIFSIGLWASGDRMRNAHRHASDPSRAEGTCQARREYNEAICNGHRAALLEENRPETFSLKVGNIPPGEAIQICIQTVSQLSIVHGEWTLRLPLVVAPRYTSGIPLPRTSSGNGICHDTDQVPDASCVTPPTWLPGFASHIDLRLVVDIEVGQLACAPDWATQLKSSLHTAFSEGGCGQGGLLSR